MVGATYDKERCLSKAYRPRLVGHVHQEGQVAPGNLSAGPSPSLLAAALRLGS